MLCLLLCGLLAARLNAMDQTITLDSGERLIGAVLPKSTDETVYLKTELFGELSIPRARVVELLVVSPESSSSPTAQVAAAEPVEVSERVEAPRGVVSETAKAVEPAELVADEEDLEGGLFNYLLGLNTPESWSGNFRMGFNISSGDSKWTETYLRGKLEVRPEDSSSLYRYTGSYTYRESEDKNGNKFKSQDKYDATFLYRYGFDNDWFVQNTASWRVDQKKGIDRDLSNHVGFGYSFEPRSTVEWNVGGSVGIDDYQSRGEHSRNGNSTSLSVFEELKWSPLERTTLVHSFSYFWDPDDSSRYNYVAKTALRVRLTDLLGFEFSHNKEYDSDTGTGQDKDDTRWLNALVLFF